ncbi:MAG: hypothetical protein IPK65_14275 [Gammaproteobacteria bacterium]|nr:hypothetical protein [Gammaproteobacteria bacterium]
MDLTAYGCPLHYVKARNELRRVAAGGPAGFLFGTEELAQQAAASLRKDGHEILRIETQGNAVRVIVRKEGITPAH